MLHMSGPWSGDDGQVWPGTSEAAFSSMCVHIVDAEGFKAVRGPQSRGASVLDFFARAVVPRQSVTKSRSPNCFRALVAKDLDAAANMSSIGQGEETVDLVDQSPTYLRSVHVHDSDTCSFVMFLCENHNVSSIVHEHINIGGILWKEA